MNRFFDFHSGHYHCNQAVDWLLVKVCALSLQARFFIWAEKFGYLQPPQSSGDTKIIDFSNESVVRPFHVCAADSLGTSQSFNIQEQTVEVRLCTFSGLKKRKGAFKFSPLKFINAERHYLVLKETCARLE